MIWPIFYFLTSLTPNIYIVANTLGEAHLATDAQYESSSKKVVSWSSETDHDFGDLKKAILELETVLRENNLLNE